MSRFVLVLAVLLVALIVPSHPAFGRDDQYGAIAYSGSTGVFGSSAYLPSRELAERAAVADCRQAGGAADCEAKLWFMNACGSAARSADGRIWAANWAARGGDVERSRRAAEQSARRSCGERGGVGCRVVLHRCSISVRID